MSHVARSKGRAGFIAGFLILPLALYLTFVIWPYVQTFGYSFTNWSGSPRRSASSAWRTTRP